MNDNILQIQGIEAMGAATIAYDLLASKKDVFAKLAENNSSPVGKLSSGCLGYLSLLESIEVDGVKITDCCPSNTAG